MSGWLMLYSAAAVQAFILAPVLWQRAIAPANRLLACWLLLVGVDLAVRAWSFAASPDESIKLKLWVIGFPFLHSSLFYLYVRSYGDGRSLRLSDCRHGLGYLFSLLCLGNLLFADADQLAAIAEQTWSAGAWRPMVLNAGLFVWSLSYVLAALRNVVHQRRELMARRSDGSPDTLLWLQRTAVWQSMIWLVAISQQLLPLNWVVPQLIYATVAAWVLALAYYALMYATTLTPAVTGDSAIQPAAGTVPTEAGTGDMPPITTPQRASESNETEPDPRVPEVAARLQFLFEQEQLYRQPALNIAQLSRRAGYPEYLVSWVINHQFGMPYWDYVNRYRVEEIRRRLLDPDEQRSALDLAYDSGFTAKSTFNSAFKRLLGETPSQCRARAAATK